MVKGANSSSNSSATNATNNSSNSNTSKENSLRAMISTPNEPTTAGTAAKRFYDSFHDLTVVERVRVTIKNAHIFKLPPRKSASGWRGADWREELWVGTCKVVDRRDQTAVMLLHKTPNPTTTTNAALPSTTAAITSNIFAICLALEPGAVDRCIDSSRYFVLRVESSQGDRKYIGLAFNDRNDAFDFNASLEDAKRERQLETTFLSSPTSSTSPTATSISNIDYSLKEGQKIHVNISKCKLNPSTADYYDSMNFTTNSNEDVINNPSNSTTGNSNNNNNNNKKTNKQVKTTTSFKGLLAPSTKDTPSSRLNRP